MGPVTLVCGASGAGKTSIARPLAARYGVPLGEADDVVTGLRAVTPSDRARHEWNTPIWEHDLETGLRILRLAIDTHLITSHHLLPLLVDRPGGLLVEVTDGTTAYNASNYRISVFYDLAKAAVNRLAFSQGHELAGLGCTAVASHRGGCARS